LKAKFFVFIFALFSILG
jgi:hypothetical protein